MVILHWKNLLHYVSLTHYTVVVWCDTLGGVQWRENSLSWYQCGTTTSTAGGGLSNMPKPLNAACTEEMCVANTILTQHMALMFVQCWDSRPSHRPMFTELVKSLSSQLVAVADYMQFNNPLCEMDGTVNGETPILMAM